jgi:hypothetical protein
MGELEEAREFVKRLEGIHLYLGLWAREMIMAKGWCVAECRAALIKASREAGRMAA